MGSEIRDLGVVTRAGLGITTSSASQSYQRFPNYEQSEQKANRPGMRGREGYTTPPLAPARPAGGVA